MLNISKGNYEKRNLNELFEIPVTPQGNRSDRWLGIQHGELIAQVIDFLKSFQVSPVNEQYYVSPSGAGLIGGFELAMCDGSGNPTGPMYLPGSGNSAQCSFGISHANDSSEALKVASGGRVFACSNGMVTGEKQMARKHTSGLRLPDWLRKALQWIFERFQSEAKHIERLRNTHFSKFDFDASLLDLARENIIPWRLLGELDKCWHEATENNQITWTLENQTWDFTSSCWDWYNAVTHIIKRLPGSQQIRSLHRAYKMALVGHIS